MGLKISNKKATFLAIVVVLASYSFVDAIAVFESSLTEALSQFANQLYHMTAASAELGTNYILSPLSCHTVLSLLTLATGETTEARKELLNTLGFKTITHLKFSYRFGIRELNFIPGVIVKVANKIFLSSLLGPTPDFEKNSKVVFRSNVEKVDFENVPTAVNTINSWVEKNTENIIKNLVTDTDIKPTTTTVLVNAVYFKGLWEKPFSPEDTFKTTFKTITDQNTDIDMMKQKSSFLYAKIDNFKIEALKMFYEKRGVSMLIILPNEDSDLRQFEKSLIKSDINIINDVVSKLKVQNVTVQLPKFKIETKIELSEALQKIGIKKIFGDDSGLSNLVIQKIPIVVTKVLQKAFIEVDELGTVAAAATAVIVGYSLDKDPFFVADRPFFFCIMQEPSGRILFAGKKEV